MAVLTLDAAVQKFAKTIDLAVELVIQRLALDLWNKITLRTPVDTGRARASWQLTVGEPTSYVPPPPDTPATGGNKGQSKPPDTPAAPFPDDVQITGNETVYITSALVYIEPLEAGHSKQAIAGMVAPSIAEVEAEIELILEGVAEQAQAG